MLFFETLRAVVQKRNFSKLQHYTSYQASKKRKTNQINFIHFFLHSLLDDLLETSSMLPRRNTGMGKNKRKGEELLDASSYINPKIGDIFIDH